MSNRKKHSKFAFSFLYKITLLFLAFILWDLSFSDIVLKASLMHLALGRKVHFMCAVIYTYLWTHFICTFRVILLHTFLCALFYVHFTCTFLTDELSD